jgi:hypothetical protein
MLSPFRAFVWSATSFRSGATNFHRRDGLGLGLGIDDDKIRKVAHRKPMILEIQEHRGAVRNHAEQLRKSLPMSYLQDVGVHLWASGSGGGAMLRRNALTKARTAMGLGRVITRWRGSRRTATGRMRCGLTVSSIISDLGLEATLVRRPGILSSPAAPQAPKPGRVRPRSPRSVA